MIDLLPLSPANSQDIRYKVITGASACAQLALLPVVAQEASRVAFNMPLAVVKDPRSSTGWSLVGVCARQPGRNVFVAPDGQWGGMQPPQSVALQPFALMSIAEGKAVPALNVRSNQLEQPPGGVPVVENGEFTPAVKEKIEALKAYYPQQLQTEQMLKVLSDAGVLSEWPHEICEKFGIQHRGLHTFDERKAYELKDDIFLSLRQRGTLALGYVLSFSMNQVPLLERIEKLRGDSQPAGLQTNEKGELDLEFLKGGDTIRFG